MEDALALPQYKATVVMNRELWFRFRRYAFDKNTNASAIIRRMIKERLDSEEKETEKA